LLSVLLSIPIAFLLVPTLGIIGLIIGSPASGVPSTFIGLYLLWKRYGVKADFRHSAKIFVSSSIAAITVYAFFRFFVASYWILLGLGSIIFLAVYLISAPLIGAISQPDVNSLRTMFSGLGIITKILDIPLNIIERVLRARKSQANI
jgi:O-antigen/teichoic acid export membrane protein